MDRIAFRVSGKGPEEEGTLKYFYRLRPDPEDVLDTSDKHAAHEDCVPFEPVRGHVADVLWGADATKVGAKSVRGGDGPVPTENAAPSSSASSSSSSSSRRTSAPGSFPPPELHSSSLDEVDLQAVTRPAPTPSSATDASEDADGATSPTASPAVRRRSDALVELAAAAAEVAEAADAAARKKELSGTSADRGASTALPTDGEGPSDPSAPKKA